MSASQEYPFNLELSPWICFCNGRGRRLGTFTSISDGTSVEIETTPKAVNSNNREEYWTCCQGWLLSRDSTASRCTLWDPISLTKLSLPPLDLQLDSTEGLSFVVTPPRPSDPNPKVVLFHCDSPDILWCSSGDQTWHKHPHEIKYGNLVMTIFQGQVYAVNYGCNLRLIQISSSSMSIKVVGRFPHFSDNSGEYYGGDRERALVASFDDSELFMVDGFNARGNLNTTFKVFKMDFASGLWVEVTEIGSQALFLGFDGSVAYSVRPQSGFLNNRIYFLHCEDERIFSYDMERGSMSAWLPEASFSLTAHQLFLRSPSY